MTEILSYQRHNTRPAAPFAAAVVLWSLVGLATAWFALPLASRAIPIPFNVCMGAICLILALGLHARKEWARMLLSSLLLTAAGLCAVMSLLSFLILTMMFMRETDYRSGVGIASVLLIAFEAVFVFLFYEFEGNEVRRWIMLSPHALD